MLEIVNHPPSLPLNTELIAGRDFTLAIRKTHVQSGPGRGGLGNLAQRKFPGRNGLIEREVTRIIIYIGHHEFRLVLTGHYFPQKTTFGQ